MASQLKQRRRPSGLPLALLGYASERLKHGFETEYPGSSSLCLSYSQRKARCPSVIFAWIWAQCQRDTNGFPQLENPSTGREWHCWRGLAGKTQWFLQEAIMHENWGQLPGINLHCRVVHTSRYINAYDTLSDLCSGLIACRSILTKQTKTGPEL